LALSNTIPVFRLKLNNYGLSHFSIEQDEKFPNLGITSNSLRPSGTAKADTDTGSLGQYFLHGDCAERQPANRMAFMMPTKLCFRSFIRVFCEREE
jgi:hypothetical protein